MKILKIVNSYDRGGIFSCEMQFIKGLRNRGIVVDLVILGEGDKYGAYSRACDSAYSLPYLETSFGSRVTKVPFRLFKTHFYGAKYAQLVSEQMAAGEQYHVIMYQIPTFIHLVGYLSKSLNSVGLWHLPNAVSSTFSRAYYNYYCNKYNITQVANSHYTKGTLGRQCKHVVYPGYDDEAIYKVDNAGRSYRDILGISSCAPVYGIAARLHPDKAQDVVVEAFVKSKVATAGGHLLIAGGPLDSDFANQVKMKAGKLLHSQVHFLGEVKNMPSFYASVDVVVNGRRNIEPFGISIAEGMGAGKPIIAYKLGGPSEMISHGDNGWLVSYPTVESYQQSLDFSFEQRENWTSMGQAAKMEAKKFTVDENVRELLKIMKKRPSQPNVSIYT